MPDLSEIHVENQFRAVKTEIQRVETDLSAKIDEVKADLAQHSHLVMAELTDMKGALTDMKGELKAIREAVEKQGR
jgi:predicted  nucleic acid-binding Zn-ribbon protein